MSGALDQAAFTQLWQAAHAGQSSAQERLADLFAGAGKFAEARHWLSQAASAGRLSAQNRLGLWEIVGCGGAQNVEQGYLRILAAARAGEAEAAHTVSILLCGGVGVRRDREEALRWLVCAAERGHQRALAQLGVLLGPDSATGAALLRKAAGAGSVVAMYALGQALRHAEEGRTLLAAAALGGHPLAGQISAPLTASVERANEIRWAAIAGAVDLSWADQPLQRRSESTAPHIETLGSFLPQPICDYVIGMAAPLLVRGKVVDHRGGESVREERSNAVMNFGLADSDFLLELINVRCAAAVSVPPENAEGLGVLHYRPGERYAPHVDYIVETPANVAQLAERGQRLQTLLVYLNDDFEGGETAFPRLDLSFKPPAGCALLFRSVDERGRVDPMTMHTGAPTTRGDKWLISKWFRAKALRPGEP